MKIPARLGLQDIQQSFRDLWDRIDLLFVGNIDLKGRRITNAGKSVNPSDYVTRAEVDALPAATQTVVTETISGGGPLPGVDDATPTRRGLVNTTSQSFGGTKTFAALVATSLEVTGTGNVLLQNNTRYQMKDTSGTARTLMYLDASNNWNFGGTAAGLGDLIFNVTGFGGAVTVKATTGYVGVGMSPAYSLDINGNLRCSTGFGCNGATPQTAYASGGAAPAGGTGATAGAYDTAAHRDALITLVNNIRAALVANGIMS